jgi:predicted house-cleaning noncanonical NTP pyrophosphatase (MazG superfamily)
MKYLFQCEKLVRDRIPDLMADENSTLIVETLDHKAHICALKKKLVEEADEVAQASTREEIIEEIADVKEVLDALILKMAIDRKEVDEIKRKKNLRNGGFDRGLYLKAVETPAWSAIAQRFLKDQLKYPVRRITE